MRLISSGRLVVDGIGEAATFRTRLLGWFDPAFRGCRGVLLHPCRSIHTLFMPQAIDVVFISAHREVCVIVENLPRNRRARCHEAAYVLELPAGMAAGYGFHQGQVIDFEH